MPIPSIVCDYTIGLAMAYATDEAEWEIEHLSYRILTDCKLYHDKMAR